MGGTPTIPPPPPLHFLLPSLSLKEARKTLLRNEQHVLILVVGQKDHDLRKQDCSKAEKVPSVHAPFPTALNALGTKYLIT